MTASAGLHMPPKPSRPERPSEPSVRRLGRYEVLGELASGGTGTVYLSRLSGPGGFERLFAIKVLHKHYANRPEVVELLLREAHLAAQVHHPHVVDIVEIGTTEDGQHYLVMGYVEGASLDDLLAHPKLDAVRRVRLGLPILLDAMSGLDAVHRAKDAVTGTPLGIVHRDVSPANILIGLDGIGRIADFGIASARAHSSISEPSVVRGTPRYMAPEQATGEAPIDARADVFALGAVLWEVITGEPLFDSSVSVEHILSQVQSATIPPPSDRNSRMPEPLDAICLRALERDVSKRYASVAELRDDLARVAEAAGLIAPSRELVSELGALFEQRVEERRAVIARAARRTSGTQLRAVVIVGDADKPAPTLELEDDLFDDKTTVFDPSAPPLAALETQALELPKRHAWRWVALVAVAFVALVAWLAHPPRAPKPERPVATLEAASRAQEAPAPTAPPPPVDLDLRVPPPQELGMLDEAALSSVKPKKKLVTRPRPIANAPAPPPAAPERDRDLPLETNPYRLQQ